MRLLDLFCGAGGAAVGYSRAGFTEIVGVDNRPQKNYPFEFVQADALEYLAEHGHEFDVIHASPPCQKFSVMKNLPHAKSHPDLVTPLRQQFGNLSIPTVIENVPGSPMENTLILCGSMFNLRSTQERYLRRHRLFEIRNGLMIFVPKCNHQGLAVGVYGHGSAGWIGQRMRTAKAPEARILMDIPWMTRNELSQAVPPAYTEYIGKFILGEN